MNILSILSFIIAIVVLITGLRLASEDLSLFLDFPSMFIVLGGTFASTAISFRLNRIFLLFKLFFIRVIKGKTVNHGIMIAELVLSADKLKKGTSWGEIHQSSNDFFFREAIGIIQDGVITDKEITEMLEERNRSMMTERMNEASKIKSIGKFAPAFGMIGTTIGMIVLLANLGGEDAMKMIGPAMGVCLITTLYGAVVANLLFVPVSENLFQSAKEVYLKNNIIIAGVDLIIQKKNPIVITEKLNSMVSPSQRVNWKELLGAGNVNKAA